MTTKWSYVTFAGAVATIIVTVLGVLGIHAISYEHLNNLIILILTMSGIGAGVKVAKPIIEKKTKTWRDIEYAGGKWFTVSGIFKSHDGNSAESGTTLTIQSQYVQSYFTVVLKDSSGKVLSIGQGDKSTPVDIKLLDKESKPLPKGDYDLIVTGDYGTSDSISITDTITLT